MNSRPLSLKDENVYFFRYFYDNKIGYTLTNNKKLSKEVSEFLLKYAQPYGQDWFKYIGLSSIKQLKFNRDAIVVSYSDILSNEDQYGRKGILDTYIIFIPRKCFEFLFNWDIKVWKKMFKFLISKHKHIFESDCMPVNKFSTLCKRTWLNIDDLPNFSRIFSPEMWDEYHRNTYAIMKGKGVILTCKSNFDFKKIEEYIHNLIVEYNHHYGYNKPISYTSFSLSSMESVELVAMPKEYITPDTNKKQIFVDKD